MDVTKIVDDAIERPVLVFGSLPPGARDLDLLARPQDRAALEETLRTTGFENQGHAWVRFEGTAVEVIDVVPSDEWALPDHELDAVFDRAIVLGGSKNLVRPAPHHVLLILARRSIRDERMADKWRARLEEALREEPAAWALAMQAAEGWGARRAISALRDAYEGDGTISLSDRREALAEELASRGMTSFEARARAWKRVTRSREPGHIVTFSGLDGSGKSTQAEMLRSSLERLGYEPVIKWTKIARSSWLKALVKPVQAVMRLRGRTTLESDRTIVTGDGPIVLDPEQAAAKDLRKRSRFLTHAWTTLVAVTNARDHRRSIRRHIRAGRIVISDRYTLDTAAHLRYRYGVDKTFKFQSMLNRIVSPSPAASYFLDVSPEAAYARKAEQYEVSDLELLRRLYLEEAERAHVAVIPGGEPADELGRWIARDVWRAISG